MDSSGNLYAVIPAQNEVQKFSTDGVLLDKWGSPGKGAGEFDSPFGIAVDDAGHVYVSDRGNNRVQKFSNDGEFLAQWDNVNPNPPREGVGLAS